MKTKKRAALISRDEWFVIGSILALSVTLIVILPFLMTASWFTTLIPPLQYVLYNSGFMFLTIILLGIPLSFARHERLNIREACTSGFATWLIFSFVLDLWQPPFAIAPAGHALISDMDSLVGTSVDYMLVWCFTHLFTYDVLMTHVFGHVTLLFFLIYFAVPCMAVIGAALLMKPGFLLELFRREVG